MMVQPLYSCSKSTTRAICRQKHLSFKELTGLEKPLGDLLPLQPNGGQEVTEIKHRQLTRYSMLTEIHLRIGILLHLMVQDTAGQSKHGVCAAAHCITVPVWSAYTEDHCTHPFISGLFWHHSKHMSERCFSCGRH
jgi:hypothetical protein